MTTKLKPPRRLINHRDVAELFGTSARNWRRWYEAGMVPIPHQQIGTLLLYDVEVINHRLATGKWPEGVTFRPKVEGKPSEREDLEEESPAGRILPSADAIPTG